MDNWQDLLIILAPIVVGVLGALANKLTGQQDESGSAPSEQPDPETREREIQDEIRRKIAERRRASGGGGESGEGETASSPAPAEREAPEPAKPTPHPQTREPARASASRERSKSGDSGDDAWATAESSWDSAWQTEKKRDFSWETSDDVYDGGYSRQVAERKRQIEETERQADAMRQEARQRFEKLESESNRTGAGEGASETAGALLSGSVRSSFRSPAAARRAFVYSEVWGAPVSMRRHSDLPAHRER